MPRLARECKELIEHKAGTGEEPYLQRPGHSVQGLEAVRAKDCAQSLRGDPQALFPQLPQQLEHPADLYIGWKRAAPLQGSQLCSEVPRAKHNYSAGGLQPEPNFSSPAGGESEHAPEDGEGQADACASGNQPKKSPNRAAWGKALWVGRAQLRRHSCRLPCSAQYTAACTPASAATFAKQTRTLARQLTRTCLLVPIVDLARLMPHRNPGWLCLLLLWARQPVF